MVGAAVMDDTAGLFSLGCMRNGCVRDFPSSSAVSRRPVPPLSRSVPLVPPARKDSCEVSCSGRKKQIKILNLSERVLINKAVYYPSVHKSEKGSHLFFFFFTREGGWGGLITPPPSPASAERDRANYSAGGLMESRQDRWRVQGRTAECFLFQEAGAGGCRGVGEVTSFVVFS